MSAKILLINGSPRPQNNSAYLLEKAKEGVMSVSDVECKVFEFAGRTFNGCRGTCSAYCMKNGTCSQKDDLQEFLELYLWADGIVWAVPTYHAGPPAQVKAALDRMGNVMSTYFKMKLPRFNKPSGIIVTGSSRYGGQEYVVDFMMHSITTTRNLIIGGESPKANMGVVGYASTWEPGSILEDTVSLEASVDMGRNVALMAKVIKAGIEEVAPELSERYFPDRMLEERRNTDIEIDMAWQKKENN